VILLAGRGTRFELESLPDSQDRVVRLTKAIAGGGLSEQVWPRRVKYELRLDDGEVLHGGSRYGLLPSLGSARQVSYLPYNST
jgi:hypothetical protein